MNQIANTLGKVNRWNRAYVALVLCSAATMVLPAQTLTTLFSFDFTDGLQPYAGLVQASDGSLYGTTYLGGAHNGGTVFKITPSGTLTTLYSFCGQSACLDGSSPQAGVIQSIDGNLYGTTGTGGANGNYGTVFKITPRGTLTTLYSFCAKSGCADGANPTAALVQAANGDFYGTTTGGGANVFNYGTVFKITPTGTLATLYSFCSQGGVNCTDGSQPSAGLVQAANGDFYGTTAGGGAHAGYGTVFKITPTGSLTTLYSFGSTDGAGPVGLVQARNGDLYGTTGFGGVSPTANGCYSANGCGTVFKITPAGRLTTLHNFCAQSACTDGELPSALVQAASGDLYGTTVLGGAICPRCGTVFKITTMGKLTTLNSFDGTDGKSPYGLVQDTNGNLYGVTGFGGAHACPPFSGCGTVFTLFVGLGPFVETRPDFGKVGSAVKILGTNMTGASSVTFNGIGAAFTVVSASEITTTVPTGATTGRVRVATPIGTLSSYAPFRVVP